MKEKTEESCRTKKILICEDSMEGIFSAVYDGWKYGDVFQVCLSMEEVWEPEFFAEYEHIPTDPVKSIKVANTIRRKLGESVWEYIGYSVAAQDLERGTAIFHTLWKALAHGRCRRDIVEELTDPYIERISRLHMKVWHEYHRFLGFVRFRDVGRGVLLSRVAPENDILEMLGPHFHNRYPGESWMIFDERRNKVLLHPAGGNCTVRRNVQLKEGSDSRPSSSDPYEQLWKEFCSSVTIEARKNPCLQQQFLPKKFRSNMTEFLR